MNISISQQVSATYARNHFKEVSLRVQKEGTLVIVHKSKPVTILLSAAEYEKLQRKTEEYKKAMKEKMGGEKKLTLEEIRKNSIFKEHIGSIKDLRPDLTSVQLAKRWTDYVD